MTRRNNNNSIEIDPKNIGHVLQLLGAIASIFISGFYLSSYYYDLKNEIKINAVNIECNQKINDALTKERETYNEKIDTQFKRLEALYSISENLKK